MSDIALALRSQLYKPDEILEFSALADSSSEITHLFFPDIPNAQESLELCTASFSVTKRIKIGSGVLRPLEHDPRIFSRRIATIQWLSKNRLALGIGTGSPGDKPRQTIGRMFSILEEIKSVFPSRFNAEPIVFPEILVAALRPRIAVEAARRRNGLLFNFCSPEYAAWLISKVEETENSALNTIACYIKIFYSEKSLRAERLLAEEFVKYDGLSQYHEMFKKDGIADSVEQLRKGLSSGEPILIPDNLEKISLANPSQEELSEHINKFRKSGVSLPCIYTYFDPNESSSFKKSVVETIVNSRF